MGKALFGLGMICTQNWATNELFLELGGEYFRGDFQKEIFFGQMKEKIQTNSESPMKIKVIMRMGKV